MFVVPSDVALALAILAVIDGAPSMLVVIIAPEDALIQSDFITGLLRRFAIVDYEASRSAAPLAFLARRQQFGILPGENSSEVQSDVCGAIVGGR